MPFRTSYAVLTVAGALLLAGCSSGSGASPRAGGTGTPTSSPSSGTGSSTPAPGTSAGSSGAPASPGSGGSGGGSSSPASSGTSAKPGSAAPSLAPAQVRLEPACVKPGGRVVIRVHSTPKSSVGFDVLYSDGNSGAAPPFGKGYGGNDKGFTDSKGDYTTNFVITPNTPPGKATARVVVGESGVGFHNGEGTFTVAGPTGAC